MDDSVKFWGKIKIPRQQGLKRGKDGSKLLRLEAHPHIRRSAQQQAQQVAGLEQDTIPSMLEAEHQRVKLNYSLAP
jgi:hypothetical protein